MLYTRRVVSAISLILIGLLMAIALIDWWQHEVWHVMTIGGTLLALLGHACLPARYWQNSILGALLLFTLFLAIYRLAWWHYGAEALGFGDVMLAMLIGAIGGIVDGLWAMAVGMLLAGLWAASLRVKGHTATIPYGTCLAIGALGILIFSS